MNQIHKEEYNVLYVDDEQSSLNALKNLYRRKFNIVTASSGQKALDILETQDVQVIVTDQRMPEMTGIEFLLKVKHKWPDLKYILLTAFDESSVIKEAINEAGIYWYLNKPFEPDQLEQIITNALIAYHTANKLKESEEKFRGVFDNMIDVFSRSDIEGNCLLISPSVFQVLGYTPDEIIGKNYSDFFVYPDEWRKNAKEITEARDNITQLEQEVYRKDGTKMFISSNAKIFYDDYGNPAGIEGVFRDISEIKNAEKLLLESESKYRSLVDNSLIGVFTTTLDGRFLFVNEAMVNLYDFDNSDQMLAEGSLGRWKDLKQREQLLLLLQRNGEVENFEAETITHTGRHIHVIFSVKSHDDKIMGMVMDITERKKAEEKLQESEKLHRITVEQAAIGIVHVSPKGEFLKVNQKFCDITGYSKDELIGMPFKDITHPDDTEIGLTKLGQMLKDEIKLFTFEKRYIRKDGNIVTVNLTTQLVRNNLGEPNYFVSMAEDITDKKRAETEHDKLFNSSFDLICIAGFDGYFKELNPYWEQITGYSLEELYATPFSEFVHPDDVEKTATEVQELFQGKGATIGFENRYITKSGKEIHLSWTVIPDSEARKMYCIARDITEQKNSADKIMVYQDRLKALANELILIEEKQRRQIATDLHDHVGQILASSRLQIAALKNSMEKEEILKNIKIISGGLSDCIQATRNAIFELSPPQLNEIGLAAALSEWMNKQLNKHDIKYKVSTDDSKYPLTDEVRYLLFRCTCELLVNVIKHSKASFVEVGLKFNYNIFYISVDDNGCGFKYNNDLPRINNSGFGLLSIYERIENISGTVQIKSVIGKGTNVVLSLPITN